MSARLSRVSSQRFPVRAPSPDALSQSSVEDLEFESSDPVGVVVSHAVAELCRAVGVHVSVGSEHLFDESLEDLLDAVVVLVARGCAHLVGDLVSHVLRS